MKTHRRLTSVASLAALVLVCAPAGAHAGSLLSGYGGPGQGSQVILGSALLNGPGGGAHGGGEGGGGSASGGGSAGSAIAGGQAAAGTHAAPAGGAHAQARAHARSGSGIASPSRGGAASAAGPGAYVTASRSARSETAVPTPTLGISAADLVYILLGLAVLVMTAALTKTMTRGPQGDGAPAKGIRRSRRVTS